MASLEVEGGEGEAGEDGLEETTAVIEEGIETSTFETDTERREAGSGSESESGTGESKETSGCADPQLDEHDRRREIFVIEISPRG